MSLNNKNIKIDDIKILFNYNLNNNAISTIVY